MELIDFATGERTSWRGMLKKIDLFRDGMPVRRLVPQGRVFCTEFTERHPQPSGWYVHVTQVDKHVAYSSPIWFE